MYLCDVAWIWWGGVLEFWGWGFDYKWFLLGLVGMWFVLVGGVLFHLFAWVGDGCC